jgi:putative ABC transport system permease protein
VRQPDRSLRADWGAAPVLVAEGALHGHRPGAAAQPGGIPLPRAHRRAAPAWRDASWPPSPALDAEVRSFDERSDRMAEVLGQIGSGLLLIGFSALFIGGLGVFNSVQAYLQGKLTSLATLRALGLRDGGWPPSCCCRSLLLALLASAVGVLLGMGWRWPARSWRPTSCR